MFEKKSLIDSNMSIQWINGRVNDYFLKLIYKRISATTSWFAFIKNDKKSYLKKKSSNNTSVNLHLTISCKSCSESVNSSRFHLPLLKIDIKNYQSLASIIPPSEISKVASF
jgi:hypothetical protein